MGNSVTNQSASEGKRALSKAANRQAILEAARGVFARLGVDSTTVRDIIRETDLAAGTFYNYFKSKDDVFEALANESTTRFRPRLAEVRAKATDFESYIRAAYRAYFEFLRDENIAAIESGAPHMALIGVRIDTPEMQSVVEEIRADLESHFSPGDTQGVDTEYVTAAAVGIAREMGDYMLKRRPVDVDGATEFASGLFLTGMESFGMRVRTTP
ncbi:MAG: TetR/AcrR family transcriptional regulator [Pseudomonadota bacterium]